jgi:integrase
LNRDREQSLNNEAQRECAGGNTNPIAQTLLVMISKGVTGMTSRCSMVPRSRSRINAAPTSMASVVRKARSKNWFAAFRDTEGRQHRKSTFTANRKEAMKVAEQYEAVAQRKLPARTVRETIAELYRQHYNEELPTASVRTFISDWLKNKEPEVAPASLAFYRKSTNKFLEYLGPAADLDLASVTRRTLTEFRNDIARKAAPKTVNADLKAVKAVMRAAKRDGYVVEDPGEFVETVRKNSERQRRPFTIAELQSVLSVADPEWKSPILFGVYTGQRLGDLAVLTWDNVDLVRSEIRFKTRKTGKQMILPIAPPLRARLENLSMGEAPGSALHPKAFGTMRRQGRSGNLSNQFSDLLAQAGAPHRSKGKGRDGLRASNALTFHSLRHTAVSLLKDAGIPGAVVMELVGHDSKEMSKHYTHVGQDALVRAAASLPEI